MLDGKTVGGNRDYAGPDETPSRASWRCASTRWAAPGSSFDEDKRGTLEVGKLADFAILDQDYFTRAGRAHRPHRLLLTVVGGKVVYADEAFVAAALTLAPFLSDS